MTYGKFYIMLEIVVGSNTLQLLASKLTPCSLIDLKVVHYEISLQFLVSFPWMVKICQSADAIFYFS